MRRYLIITLAMMTFFLALFFVVEALGVPILTDPQPWMSSGSLPAALIGIALLVSDVFLPVPSSLVMMANGALFGVWTGALLSLVGSTGAGLFGFAVGRRGGQLLHRLVTPEEAARADALLKRWGVLAIVVTRPVPIFAETLAIMSGASSLGWGTMALASLAGSIPAALVYAIAGAAFADMGSSALVFGAVILIAVAIALGSGIWKFGARYIKNKAETSEQTPGTD